MKKILIILIAYNCCIDIQAQTTGTLYGTVISEDGPVVQAAIQVKNTSLGTVTDLSGNFQLPNVPSGTQTITIRSLGYQATTKQVEVTSSGRVKMDVELKPDRLGLEEVVVSASRYELSRQDAPSAVSIMGPKLLNATQSVSMLDGLGFQPGVRLENNCQNCGFTQVRMNGLEGAYSQILVNSRAVFSAVTSVYGLEMVPANIIERVEVVRSGGSALYGASAIGGTINIITKDPVENTWQIGSNMALIGGRSLDQTINFNGSMAAEDLNSGVTLYGMTRNREAYDADSDGFSEITQLQSNTMGAKAFYKPSERSKVTIDLNAIKEYRRGGDRLQLAPHFSDIAEQLNHDILIAGITYDQYSKDLNTKVSTYISSLAGDRKSYYGGLGGGRTLEDSLGAFNAYGNTVDRASVVGTQVTQSFAAGNVLVVGAELQANSVTDEIPGYSKNIDQTSTTLAMYGQFEWRPTSQFTAFMGSRIDRVNVDGTFTIGGLDRAIDYKGAVVSPRFTLMYVPVPGMQLRGGYARGFRAPQAFDEDLHVSSVGGEQKFVLLSNNLRPEYSNAFTASMNYGKMVGNTQMSFLMEGFYTQLSNQFVRVNTGQVFGNGAILEEVRNGTGANVAGVNFEYMAAPSAKFNMQAGGTVQRTGFVEPQELFAPEEGLESEFPNIYIKRFVRTPNVYGYFTTEWKPTKKFDVDLTGIYTGRMIVPFIVNEEEFIRLVNAPSFFEVNLRFAYDWDLNDKLCMKWSWGVQNLFNSFQKDFDTGPERDANFIYGPLRPRTFFIGVKIGNIL